MTESYESPAVPSAGVSAMPTPGAISDTALEESETKSENVDQTPANDHVVSENIDNMQPEDESPDAA